MISLFVKYTQNKIIRYAISGGVAAFVALAVLYIFTDVLGVWYLFSSTIAFVFAFFVSFFLQKLWTFKNKYTHDLSRQFLLYFITALCGLALNAFFMYALVDIFKIWYMVSQILSSGALALITFFVYGNIIFHHTQNGRVLIATPLYPPDIGGPATHAKFLETELPARGVVPEILSFSSVRRFPKIVRHLLYFFAVCVACVDVKTVYALDPVSVGFPALIAAKLLRKRFLVRIAGDYAWEQFQQREALLKQFPISNFQFPNKEFVTPEEFQNKKFDFVTEARRKIEHFVARNADHIIVPSEYLKKIVKQWGVADEKIKVIYNAFEPPPLFLSKEKAREKLGVRGIVIFSAGRLVPWKGFPTLIDVIAELKKEIPDIKLYIAGDGPDEKDLRFKISDLRMNDAIVLLGKLSRDVLVEYAWASDIFVLNTGYEGFSHQLLEVMSSGVPIITTDVGGNPELIENQKTGLLVPYDDAAEIKKAIRMLIFDATLREMLVKNGMEKVRAFSKERALFSITKLLKI